MLSNLIPDEKYAGIMCWIKPKDPLANKDREWRGKINLGGAGLGEMTTAWKAWPSSRSQRYRELPWDVLNPNPIGDPLYQLKTVFKEPDFDDSGAAGTGYIQDLQVHLTLQWGSGSADRVASLFDLSDEWTVIEYYTFKPVKAESTHPHT